MNLGQLIRAAVPGAAVTQARSLALPWPMQDMLRYGGHAYLLGNQSYGPNEEVRLAGERQALTSNGVVYGIFRARADLFSQARFVWKRYGAGVKPMASDVIRSHPLLAPLDYPASILEWCEIDVATTGNSYWVLDGQTLRRLPAEWVTIVIGSNLDVDDPQLAWDARPIGVIYKPPGRSAADAEVFTWAEVAHYCPEKDPDARFRGMSWLRPAMEDVISDNGARRFLTKFWENHATPNNVVTFDPDKDVDEIKEFRDMFLEKHQGADRAFRTAFLGGGADIKVIGSSLKDLDAGNIRKQVHFDIALAAGINPMAIGLMEVNYSNTREGNRSISDRKLRYLWMKAVDGFRPLIPKPQGFELWYDTSGVSALQADALDDAEVQQKQFTTMEIGIRAGFDPDTVAQAVTTGDTSKVIGNHTNLVSVQLQPPGAQPSTGGSAQGNGAA